VNGKYSAYARRFIQDQDIRSGNQLEPDADSSHFATTDPTTGYITDARISNIGQAELLHDFECARLLDCFGDVFRQTQVRGEQESFSNG
jgi:hypothetical protein